MVMQHWIRMLGISTSGGEHGNGATSYERVFCQYLRHALKGWAADAVAHLGVVAPCVQPWRQ